jgi:hypothetical protein
MQTAVFWFVMRCGLVAGYYKYLLLLITMRATKCVALTNENKWQETRNTYQFIQRIHMRPFQILNSEHS